MQYVPNVWSNVTVNHIIKRQFSPAWSNTWQYPLTNLQGVHMLNIIGINNIIYTHKFTIKLIHISRAMTNVLLTRHHCMAGVFRQGKYPFQTGNQIFHGLIVIAATWWWSAIRYPPINIARLFPCVKYTFPRKERILSQRNNPAIQYSYSTYLINTSSLHMCSSYQTNRNSHPVEIYFVLLYAHRGNHQRREEEGHSPHMA